MRDVATGKAQIEIGGKPAIVGLGNDMSVPPGVEAVDKDTIEAGQLGHEGRAGSQAAGNVGLARRIAQRSRDGKRDCRLRSFSILSNSTMKTASDRWAMATSACSSSLTCSDGLRSGLQAASALSRSGRLAARTPSAARSRPVKDSRSLARLKDGTSVHVEDEQGAVRLNCPRNMDRLARAAVEVRSGSRQDMHLFKSFA